MRSTYDKTLATDTIIKIMQDIAKLGKFRFVESPERKRYDQLPRELKKRGIIK